MKSLHTIQTLSKIGKVLSKITFIFSIIGFCGCIVGLISLAFDQGSLIKIGGVTIHSLILANSKYSIGSMCAALTGGIIVCVGEAIVAKFAELYFKHELEAGTPFTRDGASELKKLGILMIAVSAGCTLFAMIIQEIMCGFTGAVSMADAFECEGEVALGIMFIVTSLLCKYGMEVAAKQEPEEQAVKEAEPNE